MEYVVIIAGVAYLADRAQRAIIAYRHKKLRVLYKKFQEVNESAKMKADLLWEEGARQLATKHVRKREAEGTLPRPLLPIDPVQAYEQHIKYCFLEYALNQLVAPYATKYFNLAAKLPGDPVDEELEHYKRHAYMAKETLHDVGFDIEQLDRQLATL